MCLGVVLDSCMLWAFLIDGFVAGSAAGVVGSLSDARKNKEHLVMFPS